MKLTKTQETQLRRWLGEVENQAQVWGDLLDPDRTFQGGGLVGHIDGLRRKATDAIYYLGVAG